MTEDTIAFAAIKTEAIRYAGRFSGLAKQWLIRLRPYICPFDMILYCIPTGGSVFDIGCGSGFLLHAASALRGTARAAGVDYNAQTIASAEQALAADFPDGSCTLVAGATPDSWPEGEFDAVTMIDVLHHVPENMQRTFLIEAARRVRPGGVVIIKDMAKRPLFYNVMNRLHDLLLARQWIRYPDENGIVSILQDAGLEIVDKRKKRLYWYAHWMVTLAKKAEDS